MSSSLKDLVSGSYMERGRLRTSKTGNDLRELYKIFREAFLDGGIKFYKPIAFKVSTKTGYSNVNAVGRSSVCLESQLDIARLVSKMSFIKCRTRVISINCSNDHTKAIDAAYVTAGRSYKSGEISNMSSIEENVVPILVLNEDIVLPRAVSDNFDLRLICDRNCGRKDVGYNVSTIKNKFKVKGSSDFFTIEADYTLAEHIRILPFNGYDIRYALDSTSESISILWDEFVKEVEECQN